MSLPYLPKSLFGRALLILVLPTLLIQIVTAYIFFDRHWDDVSRRMSNSLSGEVAFLINQLKDIPAKQKTNVVKEFEEATKIDISFDNLDSFNLKKSSKNFPYFQESLRSKISEPFIIQRKKTADTNSDIVDISIKMAAQTLRLRTSVKRLESPTTTIFIAWMLGATMLFLFIAIIFLRNRIRPISRLAEEADNFGRGVETPNFRPSGATEVRKASRAFITMRERIKRQLRTRTDMLSGISHDLRTPLTRMKLQLAMLPADITNRDDMREAIMELDDDVHQMQQMIAEYLDFARDEGREETVRISLSEFLEDVVADYKRMNQSVEIIINATPEIDIRLSSCRRMLHNIIDNALRYGTNCKVLLQQAGNYAEILIDDNGVGIPEEKREEVFKPFSRLEPSRNSKTGGVGLGLSIAKDVALAHGGKIELSTAPKGGLRVIIRLPL